jgi:hypothetical protein
MEEYEGVSPAVSIILPVRDDGAYVAPAVDSISIRYAEATAAAVLAVRAAARWRAAGPAVLRARAERSGDPRRAAVLRDRVAARALSPAGRRRVQP